MLHSSVESWVIMQMSARMTKNQVVMAIMRLAMTCFEDAEDDKNENGDGENKFESKNSEDDERKVGPGTPRNTEEPDRIPSTTPGAEPPRDAKDSGSARSHSTHLETSSSNRP